MDYMIVRFAWLNGEQVKTCLAMCSNLELAEEMAYSCHIRFQRSDIAVIKMPKMETLCAYQHTLPNHEDHAKTGA